MKPLEKRREILELNRRGRNVFVIFGATLLTAFILICINWFWLFPVISLKSFVALGSSMAPTLQDGDRMLVSGLYYKSHKVSRGDIILFSIPAKPERIEEFEGETFTIPAVPERIFIKRVLALGGEKLTIKGTDVYINGRKIKIPWSINKDGQPFTHDADEYTIPKGKVFLVGDNWYYSKDSRDPDIGFVDQKRIIGKALLIYLSSDPNRIGIKL